MGVAAAIAGAAVIGGVSTAVAGSAAAKAQANAAKTASDASERATQLQIEEARRQYDQTRTDYAPYRAVGYGALGKLSSLYGIDPIYEQETKTTTTPGTTTKASGIAGLLGKTTTTPGTTTTTTTPVGTQLPITSREQALDEFYTSPQYTFVRDEGLKAIDRQNAARGVLNSGGADKARMRYASGVASSEYDSYANRLAALAGVGQSATGSTAAAGQASSNAITGALAANGANQSAAATAAGNARASSYANIGSAINGTVNNLASLYLYNQGGGFGGAGSTPPIYGGTLGGTY